MDDARESSFLADLLAPSRPYVVLLMVYLVAVILMTLIRLLFVFHYQDMWQGESTGTILSILLQGAWFDHVVILSILAFPALLLPWISLRMRWFRWLIGSWLVIWFSIVFLWLLVDIRYFTYYQMHLGQQVLDSLFQGNIDWYAVVNEQYFSRTMILWVLFSAAFAFLVRRFVWAAEILPHQRSWAGQIIYFVAVVFVMQLAYQGYVHSCELDQSLLTKRQSRVLHYAKINAVFSFGQELLGISSDMTYTHLPDQGL